MNILIVTQYFWPENFKINNLALDLKKRGHNIIVLTGIPNYPGGKFYEGYSFFRNKSENWMGIQIYRSKLFARSKSGPMRLVLNYLSFSLFASLKVFTIKQKIDKIFVYEPSPVTVGIPAIVAKKHFNAEIYFWVQDLWPQSLVDAGGLTNSFILNYVENLTKYIYKNSKVILIQSKAFREYIERQGVESNKIHYFPNLTEAFYKVESIDYSINIKFPHGFNILFAGNIGEAQSFETLLQAAIIIKKYNYPIYWNVVGDGRQKNYFKQKIIDNGLENNFIFHGAYPPELMPKLFAMADVLLVSLKKSKIFSLTIPAKIQSYLACGKPILGAIDGEGARIIIEANAGFVCEAENSKRLSELVIEMYNLSDDNRNVMGEKARAYFEIEFDNKKLLDNLESILKI